MVGRIKSIEKSIFHILYGTSEAHKHFLHMKIHLVSGLIKIPRYAGEIEIVDGIRGGDLEHQMNESFVFYNSELFSPHNGEMVPVKNPVQFWPQ